MMVIMVDGDGHDDFLPIQYICLYFRMLQGSRAQQVQALSDDDYLNNNFFFLSGEEEEDEKNSSGGSALAENRFFLKISYLSLDGE